MTRRIVELIALDAGSYSIFTAAVFVLYQVHFAQASSTSEDSSSTTPVEGLTSEVPVAFFICSLAVIAFEILDFTTKRIGDWLGCKRIPVRGKHLDDFRPVDQIFVVFSKANTGPFTYLFFRYLWFNENVIWDWRQMTLSNALMAIPLLYVTFDASYGFLHWVLHWQSLYPYIHKHHHVQKAPSRGSVDAANVHPIEMFLGEYNHILALFLVSSIMKIHFIAAFCFLVAGGVIAGVNHTRHDINVSIPLPGGSKLKLFDSKDHDVHHRIPQSNYGQYTMFWDKLLGSYRYDARLLQEYSC